MWDSAIKNVSAIVAVATVLGSAIAFFVQRGDELKSYERESKRAFLEKKAEVYYQVVALASKMAVAESPERIDELDARALERLYWGNFATVEDGEPAKAMTLFMESLQAFRRKGAGRCARMRKAISLTLAHCIRKSLGKSWGVSFQDVTVDTCNQARFSELEQACPVDGAGFRDQGGSKGNVKRRQG